MTYYTLTLEANPDDQGIGNWKRAIDHVLAFPQECEAVDEWNFNRYNGEIETRFDITHDAEEDVKAVAERMRNRGEIQGYEPGEWNEPDFVQSAHAIATECAIRFRTRVDDIDDLDELMSAETILRLLGENNQYQWFASMYCLIGVFLDNLGSQHRIVWDYKRKSWMDFSKIQKAASACVTQEMQERASRVDDEDLPSFTERFVHLFLNCIGWQKVPVQINDENQLIEVERHVNQRFLFSTVWNQLGHWD